MSSVQGRYRSRTRDCKHCGGAFWSESGRADVCPVCRRERTRDRMAKWIAGHLEEHRARSRSTWKPRDRVRANASAAVYRAVKRGDLTALPCEICGSKAEAHHEDYSRPLDVQWLCRKHHAISHRKDQVNVIGK